MGCTSSCSGPRHPPPLAPDQALFLDFDGTLVNLAPAPDQVRVAREVPDLLMALSRRLSGAVAIVSGRAVDDLRRLLAPFNGTFAGQHGIELRREGGRLQSGPPEPALVAAVPALAEFAAAHQGVLLEDKGMAAALHYRNAPELATACRAVADAAVRASRGGLRMIEGKMVVELLPRGLGKGTAIAAILAEPPFRGRQPVFVGDDATDEDGFGVVEALGGLTIRVGEGTSRARCRLAGVGDVLAWLSELSRARLDRQRARDTKG